MLTNIQKSMWHTDALDICSCGDYYWQPQPEGDQKSL